MTKTVKERQPTNLPLYRLYAFFRLHYTPERNKHHSRADFFELKREPGESVSDVWKRILQSFFLLFWRLFVLFLICRTLRAPLVRLWDPLVHLMLPKIVIWQSCSIASLSKWSSRRCYMTISESHFFCKVQCSSFCLLAEQSLTDSWHPSLSIAMQGWNSIWEPLSLQYSAFLLEISPVGCFIDFLTHGNNLHLLQKSLFDRFSLTSWMGYSSLFPFKDHNTTLLLFSRLWWACPVMRKWSYSFQECPFTSCGIASDWTQLHNRFSAIAIIP